ncbi:Glycosyltransferase, catalytic subunit of cellulose synthase and poly-beta-1,6-N-acetylglucosamine synthase [Halobacillus alkaliphilus]|uniref:Glycosyltransferase, catalytic subunit of cellulose synthase and poly-beta-1,6-N-acetylglucosamine synthase n=1 Tax=Halobacillus alkaliphilus TaxID=396056 RepID=A0A1I2L2G8_9BACI|nr:glycosyltransferase [Halobacillus alkaliphilus]SFF73395.1 Glycosyltransferase, catalytic subunit of cellulose synthase and poly-beta-1,6-N-acetylglucosamine synthase [Halobacillus alkaliphilus]
MELFLTIFFCLCLFFPLLHILHCLPFFNEDDENVSNYLDEKKGISILIPSYNEDGIIETSINSMIALAYPNYEVIYVNDGSSDETFKLLQHHLDLQQSLKPSLEKLSHKEVVGVFRSKLYPNIYVVNKVNGGKADALNVGIEYAEKELVVTLDADTVLTPPALEVVNEKFLDPNVIAAGGMVHALQTKSTNPLRNLSLTGTNILVRVQMLDFLKAFYVTKLSLARFRALAIISGAFGIFKKDALINVGGYRSSIGEDIDITLKIHRYIAKEKSKKVLLITNAISYTELPETWKDLFKQRIRWQKSYMDCLVHFRSFLGKTVLSRAVSFFYIVESFFVGILAAYISAGFFIVNAFLNIAFVFLGFVVVYLAYIFLFNFIYNLLAIKQVKSYGFIFSKGDTIRLLNTVIFDVFIHRFVTMYIVMYGSIAYFFNRDWKKVSRTGRNYEIDSVSQEKMVK